MTLRIQRHFIAAVAATAIAITGISTIPARAGNDDAARALALILGLAVIGKVVSDQNNSRKALPQFYTAERPYYAPEYQREYQSDRRKKLRPLPKRVSGKLLPQQCLRSFETNRGRARMFGQRCLERKFKHVRKLPDRCERRVRTDRGWREGYSAKCLSRHGYQLARR